MSLPVAYVLKDKHVLVVGGGAVAETRVRKLVPTGARLTLVATQLTEYLATCVREKQITAYVAREFRMSDLHTQHWSWVLTAIDDHNLSQRIGHKCRELRIPVNVADVPPLCDFYFGSNYNAGALSILVSTGSAAPRLSKRVLNEIAAFASQRQYREAIENVQRCRAALREYLPEQTKQMSDVRMRVMKTLCDKCTWQELAALSPEETRAMVRGMVLSIDACPAHPVPQLENAADFVEPVALQSQGEDESDTTEDSDSSSSDSSDSSSESEDSTAVTEKKPSPSSANSAARAPQRAPKENSPGSSSSESSSNPSSSSSESDDSDSAQTAAAHNPRDEHAIKTADRKRSALPTGETAKRKVSDSMLLKAVECSTREGLTEPEVPPFPYPRPQHWQRRS